VRVHADYLSALFDSRQTEPIICFVQFVFGFKLDLLITFLINHSYIAVRHTCHCVVNLSFFFLVPTEAHGGVFARVDQDREERITTTIFILVISTDRCMHVDNLIILSWYIYTASWLSERSFVNRYVICLIDIFLSSYVEGL